jgi:hypothetical protein
MLPRIPLETGTPVALLARYPDKASALAAAAANTFGLPSRLAARALAPWADRLSRRWLAAQENPYLTEIDAMAAMLGIPGVHALNVCFEWGCTSGVWPSPAGPVLRRVMDWGFPCLGENMVVLRQQGPAGEFFSITWPGVSGVFQGWAPGRFAIAINQAPMRKHGAGFLGDWLINRIAVKKNKARPPAHLLRQVFEHAPDYESAVQILCDYEVAVPAIFVVAGPESACIIERSETVFGLREMRDTGLCVANHFETALNGQGKGWRPRPIDSAGRLACANGLCETHFAEDFGWFVPPIANANSRLAFAVSAQGPLALMGTRGAKPATEIFRLS